MCEKALEFLADLINQRQSDRLGYSILWRCLPDNLKERYLAEARQMVEAWDADEEAAEQVRKP